MTPPLVLDIDGTLTRPDKWGIDPRIFDALREWDAPVVLATGKAFPYPIALCHFAGIPELVVAENGGVVYTGDDVHFNADPEAPWAVAEAYEAAGYSLGWGPEDTVNRWRETEIAVEISQPEAPLREIAADHVGIDLEEAVAIGDSENDVSTFAVVGRSFAVSNADAAAREAADEVLEGAHADGTLAVLERVREDG